MWVARQTREEVGAVDQAEVAELVRVSWAKTAAKPGGEQERDRDQGEQLAVAGARLFSPVALVAALASSSRRCGRCCLSASLSLMSSIRSRRLARAQVVAGDRVAALARQRSGLDRDRVALVVELDPEGQLVGQAAVEGDAAAGRRCRGTRPGGCRTRRRRRPPRSRRGRRAPWPRCAGGGAAASAASCSRRSRRRGGGAAADLGRRSARPPRPCGPISVAPSGSPCRGRGVLERGRRAR